MSSPDSDIPDNEHVEDVPVNIWTHGLARVCPICDAPIGEACGIEPEGGPYMHGFRLVT